MTQTVWLQNGQSSRLGPLSYNDSGQDHGMFERIAHYKGCLEDNSLER